jgi:hypothetical protein
MAEHGGATIKSRLGVLFIALLPLGLAIAAACGGGGGELTLDEYFERLDTIRETDDLELGKLETEFLGNTGEGQTWIEVETFQDFCSSVVQHYKRVIADLESMDPPPLVRGAHDEYIATQVEAMRFFTAIKDRAWHVSTPDEFIDVVLDARGSAWREIEDREDEWCFALENIGVRSGIEVNLGCSEGLTQQPRRSVGRR